MTFFKKAGRARKFQSQINANGLKDGLRVADVVCSFACLADAALFALRGAGGRVRRLQPVPALRVR